MSRAFPDWTSWVVLLLLLSAISGCRPFRAERVKGNYQFDMKYPIERAEIEGFKNQEASQDNGVWCWAACAVMVRNHYLDTHPASTRPAMDQKQIVDKINGRPTDKPQAAERTEVVAALDVERYGEVKLIEEQANSKTIENFFAVVFDKEKRKQAEAIKKQREAIEAAPQPAGGATTKPSLPAEPNLGFDPAFVVTSLRDNHEPLVAALRSSDKSSQGHVVVIYGAEFQVVPHITKTSVEPEFEPRLMCVKFFDPWNDKQEARDKHKTFGGEHVLAASEFAEHCDFMASPTSARAYLDYLDAYNRNALIEAKKMFEVPTTAPATPTP